MACNHIMFTMLNGLCYISNLGNLSAHGPKLDVRI